LTLPKLPRRMSWRMMIEKTTSCEIHRGRDGAYDTEGAEGMKVFQPAT
jgi:hypothetical protein